MRQQQRVDTVPLQWLYGQKGFSAGCHGGQHRLEIAHDQAEQIDARAADGLHLRGLLVRLGQRPGRLVGDVGIGLVGQRHNLAQCLAVVTALIVRGDLGLGGLELCHQCGLAGLRTEHAIESFAYEACTAAGDVHHFAHQIRVYPRHEIVKVQVQIVHGAGELGGKVIAQILRVQMREIIAGIDEGAT